MAADHQPTQRSPNESVDQHPPRKAIDLAGAWEHFLDQLNEHETDDTNEIRQLQSALDNHQTDLDHHQIQLIGQEHRIGKIIGNAHRYIYKASRSQSETDKALRNIALSTLGMRVLFLLFVGGGGLSVGVGTIATAWLAWDANKVARRGVTVGVASANISVQALDNSKQALITAKDGNKLVEEQNAYLRQQLDEIATDRDNQLRAREAELLKTIYADRPCLEDERTKLKALGLLDDSIKNSQCPEEGKRAREEAIRALAAIIRNRNTQEINKLKWAERVSQAFDPNSKIHRPYQDLNLARAQLQDLEITKIDLRGANLRGANLRGANLRGAYLQRAKLEDANLLFTKLEGANLQGAKLEEANLQGAKLQGANLEEANLLFTNLRGADLQLAILRGAKLRGADLQLAILQGAYLRRATYTKETIWPDDFNPKARGAILVDKNAYPVP